MKRKIFSWSQSMIEQNVQFGDDLLSRQNHLLPPHHPGGLRLWDCERVPIIQICEIAEATPPPPSKAVGAARGCWPYWSYWRVCQHITMIKVDKTRTMLTHQRCQWTCAPAAYIYVDTIPQSTKSNLVPRTQILGPFGPPKKRVNFDICNKQRKWVFCDSVNLTH